MRMRFGDSVRRLFRLTALAFGAILAAAAAASAAEQLIIFVQPGASRVDAAFQERSLPEIRKLAEAMQVQVHRVDASRGAPPEVAITPLIVFQNHRGRSVYQGRYTTLERIRNFLRTSRFVPQAARDQVREETLVWQSGRARIWAPVKISRVTGAAPPGPGAYDHDAFVREARKAMESGLTRFKTADRVSLSRADRGFYMDLYPWLSDDGTLFISLALYSQFHCKSPVFEKKTDPLVGPWEERSRLFREAARILEAAVAAQTADPASGDGFDPVAASVPAPTWEQIGFPLPEAPKAAGAQPAADGPIPRKWRLAEPGPDDPPVIQFHFAAPLDHYRGEAARFQGALDLAEDLRLEGASGWVTADPASVTMGDGSLDSVLMGSLFLDVRNHPEAAFRITAVQGDGRPLAYGRMSVASVAGLFRLKGKEIPLNLAMEMEPVLGMDHQPRLLARGMFQIDLAVFGIEGADGPAPANRSLVIDLFLPFSPDRG